MALLTAEDVLNKKFQVVKFREGYDQVEVDEFLDEVVATVYALQVENAELKEQLEAANRRIADLSAGAPVVQETVVDQFVDVQPEPAPAPVPVPEPEPAPAPAPAPAPESDSAAATSMLALAQRLHDEYVSDGQAESERIVSEAQAEAAKIVAEADDNRNQVLAQLDQERGSLEAKINELRSFESDYRRSLTDHLQSLLSEVSAEN